MVQYDFLLACFGFSPSMDKGFFFYGFYNIEFKFCIYESLPLIQNKTGQRR